MKIVIFEAEARERAALNSLTSAAELRLVAEPLAAANVHSFSDAELISTFIGTPSNSDSREISAVLRDDESADLIGVAHKRARQTGIVLACLCASIAACADTWLGAPNGAIVPIAISEHIEASGARLYFETRAITLMRRSYYGFTAAPAVPSVRSFNSDLERRFLVVYYEQRDAGDHSIPKRLRLRSPSLSMSPILTGSSSICGRDMSAFLKGVGRAEEARIAIYRAIALANTPAEAAHIRAQIESLPTPQELLCRHRPPSLPGA